MTIKDAIHSLLSEAHEPGAYYEVDQEHATQIGYLMMALRDVSPASDKEIQRVAEDLYQRRVKG